MCTTYIYIYIYTHIYLYTYNITNSNNDDNDHNNNSNNIDNNRRTSARPARARSPQLIFIQIHRLFRVPYSCDQML